jgi:hypothetical protein
MKKLFYPSLTLFLVLFVASCTSGSGDKPLSAEEKSSQDSLSRIEQRMKADSLRGTNPLLIVPPDSAYTGDYVDKYPNGITKFKGLFRFGERHGQWMSFYPNGLVWSEMHYDKGLRHGPNMAYYTDGILRYSGFYKNDLKDSVWAYYDSLGVMAQKILFKNDRFVKELPLK